MMTGDKMRIIVRKVNIHTITSSKLTFPSIRIPAHISSRRTPSRKSRRVLPEIHRRLRRHRDRRVPRREVRKPVLVLQIGDLRRSIIEIESVTERIVLEVCMLASSALVPIEPPYESLPPRTGDDLRPLPDLHQGGDSSGQPALFVLRHPNFLPPGSPDGGRSGGAEARYAEAAAFPREEHFGHVFA